MTPDTSAATATPSAQRRPPAARLPTAPYPATLIDLRTRGDQRLLLRPVLPQDDLLVAELLAGLSPAARRNRFHGVLKLPFDAVQRMCSVDYVRHLALVVTAECEGVERVLADARYAVAEDGLSAEFALLVHEQWQRRGIGAWALQALELAAHRAGLQWLTGDVLLGNTPMLALVQRCGFVLSPDPEDIRLVRVQRRLGLPQRPRRGGGLKVWLDRLVPGRGHLILRAAGAPA